MDACVHLFCVCAILCIGSRLATGWSPVQEVLPTAYRIKIIKNWPSYKGLYSHTEKKMLLSVLEIVGLRVPNRNICNNMFTCSSSHCPSARCVSTANTVSKFTDNLANLVWVLKAKLIHFSSFMLFFVSFVLCCLIAVVCIRLTL
jgi:hypothetical protein